MAESLVPIEGRFIVEKGDMIETITRRATLRLGAASMALPAMGLLAAGCRKPAVGQTRAVESMAKQRRLVWIPQATGDWELPIRVGQMEFCRMVNWDYQHIGNPIYSVQNHLDQMDEAISARPDVIVTELESPGMVSGFQRALERGITVVIVDQVVGAEAAKLGLGHISQDPEALGQLNGLQAAEWAERISGKKDGVILIGNGNPGSALIEALQISTEAGVAAYNQERATHFTTESFADSAFDDIATSISKYSYHLEQKGDDLVAMVGLGGASGIAIWKTMQENDIAPGKRIAAGSTDIFPDQQTGIEEGYLQWGIDQDFLVMGFLSAVAAWLQVEHGYPAWRIGSPGQVITRANVAEARKRTGLWVQRARELGLIAS
jgi:ABC-type sugar transport system substrate-binding protein